jgi:hypothetical protein
MKTVSEWNKQHFNRHNSQLENQPQPAGVACDVCGNEMLQQNKAMALASLPPKVFVWCLCGSTSYKLI